jgi:hypothetical protein
VRHWSDGCTRRMLARVGDRCRGRHARRDDGGAREELGACHAGFNHEARPGLTGEISFGATGSTDRFPVTVAAKARGWHHLFQSKNCRDRRLEFFNQFGIHELVVVRNVHDVNWFFGNQPGELGEQP